MADLNFIPRESATPQIVAGIAPRESVLVDLAAWPSIAQRISLEERLLAHTCPYSGEPELELVSREDERLLLLISHERFGGEHALLRSQAITALGRLDSPAARERLNELAFDPGEHDQIRVAALTGLDLKDERLIGGLADDISPVVREFALRLSGGTKCGRHEKPRRAPTDILTDEESTCCCRKQG
jgi:hypothetical protein